MTLNGRMTVTAAVACVLVSSVLLPLFTNTLWFIIGAGAVIAVAGTGALTRLRTLPVSVCLAAGVVGLLLYLNLIFEVRHSLLLVIPTPGSLTRLWHLAGTGLHDANRYAPPAPNLPGLLLLAAGGVGITAVLTDLIAVRLRSTALAGLPLLVLFTVPVTMNASHSQLATAVVFCLSGVGYLAMLSADGRERIRVWGRLVSLWRAAPRYGQAPRATGFDGNERPDTPRRARGRGIKGLGPDTRALAAAGRRVGLASIVLALCAPLIVPGLHASKLFSSGPGIGGTGGSGGQSLTLPSALSQAVAQLHESQPRTLFTYTTNATQAEQAKDAQYFRQYVFDTMGDSGWEVDNYAARSVPVDSIPGPQGLTDSTELQTVRTTVNAGKDFRSPPSQPTFLPLPYPAIQVTAPGKWLADPDRMVYSTSDSIAGQSYSAASAVVDPSTVQLETVPGVVRTPALAPDLTLPPAYRTSALKKLAVSNSAGQTTEFGKVNALATWLSGSHFTYTLAAPTLTSAPKLLNFLTKGKSGFCVQYAYAMTVLTRLLGIPARFVVGYTGGTRQKDGSYVVRNTDSHAWTEVYFPTLGWIRFEPTPAGQGTANAPDYMTAGAKSGQGGSAHPILGATQPQGAVKSAPRVQRAGPDRPARRHRGRAVWLGQAGQHSVDCGRAGRDRRVGAGLRADLGRRRAGPATAGRASGRLPPPAPRRDRRRRGHRGGRPGCAGLVPADGADQRAEPGRRLGHRRHRVRRHSRRSADHSRRVPPGAAPLAVDAGRRRRQTRSRRLARIPRRPRRLRPDQPSQRATPDPGRPRHHHAGRTRRRGRHPPGPGRGTSQLRRPARRITEPAPGRHRRPPRPGRQRAPVDPLARGRLPRLDDDRPRRSRRADPGPDHDAEVPAPHAVNAPHGRAMPGMG